MSCHCYTFLLKIQYYFSGSGSGNGSDAVIAAGIVAVLADVMVAVIVVKFCDRLCFFFPTGEGTSKKK